MSAHSKSDKYFKWFLVIATLYFLGHFIAAAVQSSTYY